jgi:hypothetical protein
MHVSHVIGQEKRLSTGHHRRRNREAGEDRRGDCAWTCPHEGEAGGDARDGAERASQEGSQYAKHGGYDPAVGSPDPDSVEDHPLRQRKDGARKDGECQMRRECQSGKHTADPTCNHPHERWDDERAYLVVAMADDLDAHVTLRETV